MNKVYFRILKKKRRVDLQQKLRYPIKEDQFQDKAVEEILNLHLTQKKGLEFIHISLEAVNQKGR